MKLKQVIGCDEVGRGCLAGDVTVAAVMAPMGTAPVEGIRDSKKLSARRREALSSALHADPHVHIAIVSRPVKVINDVGINKALQQCFLEAIGKLLDMGLDVGAIRADGKPAWPVDYFDPITTQFIIGGDDSDWAIGAASIVAKVARDAYMVEQAKEHLVYEWHSNKGYGSEKHIAAIREHGLTPLHRTKFCRNFAPPPPVEDEIDVDLINELFGEDT